jgi:hypothetical protein
MGLHIIKKICKTKEMVSKLKRSRDSPHLFGLALTQDLAEWQYPQAPLLQYIDDILFCGPNEAVISRATEFLLNFLEDRGYKISKENAQLCPLGLHI